MNMRQVFVWCLVIAWVALGTLFTRNQALAQRGPDDDGDGMQVLTRGPVHEAFAETVTFNPEPGLVVSQSPPAAIEELPPDQKPEGNNVAWIPGYWAWDDERTDFLWVSGIWRNLPPGRQWVPGYWGASDRNSQWISGYWSDAAVRDVVYLPEPPATVESGPNITAPSAEYGWIPGNWQWNRSRYVWRPGYWAPAQQDWTWSPAHYHWTPRGYVYVDGYWDYSVARRGVLFAPVYFKAGNYSRPGFSYSPATVINLAVFSNHLFLRPNHQHYYFGDYYAASYQGSGFYSSYSYNSGRYGYDPISAHERWNHRQDQHWGDRVQAEYQHRRDHEEARPPRTWADQRGVLANPATTNSRDFTLAAPLSQFAKLQDNPLRFQPLAAEQRQELGKHGREVQRFSQERQELEKRAAESAIAVPGKPIVPERMRFRPSPLVATSAERLGQDQVPPQPAEFMKPASPVEPKPGFSDQQPKPSPSPRIQLPKRSIQPRLNPDRPTPQPEVTRPFDPDRTDPRTELPKPRPHVEQPSREPRPQPAVQPPVRQPRFPVELPLPRVERPAPQPRIEPPVRQPRGNESTKPPKPPKREKDKEDKDKKKEKEKEKEKDKE
jgi:hypothetical protein